MVALENSPLFSQLAAEELRPLRAAATELRFAKGADIFKEGDTGDGVYVVKDGLVHISSLVGSNTRHVFSKINPGEIFGEMAVLENKPRSATATAAQDTVVYFIPRDTVLALVERSPRLAAELLREISARLREFNRQYISEVLQAERLSVVGRFARSIIHDLKNPLSIINLTAELAGQPDHPAESRQAGLDRIRKQVGRINELINEILEFTQGTSHTFKLTPTNYAAFVAQVADELRPDLAVRDIAIEFENAPPAVTLALNPNRLRRVWQNLAANAADAMPKRGKIIIRFAAANGEITTEFEDTGPGIAPAIANTLFEPFATHGKTHGTGLGLSICKKIIEDHRGRITARNEPGRGAIFSFSLPVAKSA
ncbi:MAG: cyclic nucleotide-binding domain-containing protein [Verrucomicrobia bacterium]|nr:cyclic nucleotide-binding domain-containing protein [Verrucomicrobiota bacterium]